MINESYGKNSENTFNRLKEFGPKGFPVNIVAEVRRHAQKGPDGISKQGQQDAIVQGQQLAKSAVFKDAKGIKGYHSQMPRSKQTLEAFLEELEPLNNPYSRRAENPILLGFGLSGNENTFWAIEGNRLEVALEAYQKDTNPNKEALTPDEIEIPIIVNWLNRKDEKLVALYAPADAAADASIPLARIIESLTIVNKEGPLVRNSVGLVAITHRGAFESLLISGILRDENGNPVTDIMEMGGPFSLLGGFRVEASRDYEGNIKSEVIVDNIGKDKLLKKFIVDLNELSELYKQGIRRAKNRKAETIDIGQK